MGLLQNSLSYIVPFLGILTVLVFIHELGHYLAARWNGVKVEVFSIGFGPEVVGWTDCQGTRWKVSLFPLGGYVRMLSDANAASQPDLEKIMAMTEEEKKHSLVHKTVWQRIQVSFAGPFANYLFATLVFGVLFVFHGQKVPTEKAKIGVVVPHSPADKAGLKQGDEILEINGQKVSLFSEVYEVVRQNPEKELTLLLQRPEENEHKILKVVPDIKEVKDPQGHPVKIGILGIMQGVDLVKRPPLTSLWYATKYVLSVTWETLGGIWEMVKGARSTESLSGPIGIAKMTAEIAQTTWTNILWFMAFLSLNLGLINLLPIPMLDGGHLLFYLIEAIRGKPLSEKAQEYGFRIGLAIVLGIFLLSTWNDVSRFQWLKHLFN